MNYDFQKQALAPLSLSLKHESNLYDPAGLGCSNCGWSATAPEPAP